MKTTAFRIQIVMGIAFVLVANWALQDPGGNHRSHYSSASYMDIQDIPEYKRRDEITYPIFDTRQEAEKYAIEKKHSQDSYEIKEVYITDEDAYSVNRNIPKFRVVFK